MARPLRVEFEDATIISARVVTRAGLSFMMIETAPDSAETGRGDGNSVNTWL